VKVVSVIGLGRVGKAVSFLLTHSSEPLLLNLIDPWLNLGAFEDLSHAHVDSQVIRNDHDLLPHSEIIFHCAGPEVPPGASRLAVRDRSYELTEKIFSNLSFGNNEPLVIVLSNPVDLITHHTLKITGLPPERVLGTGTLLDTRRFNILSERSLGLKRGSVDAVLLGEHGQSCVLWGAGSRVSGELIGEVVEPSELTRLLEETKRQAAYIKKHQGATYYGVARCAVDLMRMHNGPGVKKSIASVLCPKRIGQALEIERPVCLSLPVELGKGKLTVKETQFEGVDLENLRRSAHVLLHAAGGG